MKKRIHPQFLLLFAALTAWQCTDRGPKPVTGSLEISYRLNMVDSTVIPSYQTAIWLEDEKGTYIRSLLVSDYLSYGGFNDSTICPDWRKKVNWDTIPDAEFDAVTAATPQIRAHTLLTELAGLSLKEGVYRYYVETHIQEKYNVLYSGTIELKGRKTESTATASYVPEEFILASNLLSNVTAAYNP